VARSAHGIIPFLIPQTAVIIDYRFFLNYFSLMIAPHFFGRIELIRIRSECWQCMEHPDYRFSVFLRAQGLALLSLLAFSKFLAE